MRISFHILLLFLFLYSIQNLNAQGENKLKIAKLRYSGGGDWYANPTSLPNLIQYCNSNLGTQLAVEEDVVDPGSPDIFLYPFVHMTGHGNVLFSQAECENLRTYLYSGGFLHIDDNYGMDPYIRTEIKKIFPNIELKEVPFSHPIYKGRYTFSSGLPKIHEHDGKAPQGFGIFIEDRLVLFYTYECDLGDGWEDPEVHNDPQDIREKALQMGANILQYAFLGGQ